MEKLNLNWLREKGSNVLILSEGDVSWREETIKITKRLPSAQQVSGIDFERVENGTVVILANPSTSSDISMYECTDCHVFGRSVILSIIKGVDVNWNGHNIATPVLGGAHLMVLGGCGQKLADMITMNNGVVVDSVTGTDTLLIINADRENVDELKTELRARSVCRVAFDSRFGDILGAVMEKKNNEKNVLQIQWMQTELKDIKLRLLGNLSFWLKCEDEDMRAIMCEKITEDGGTLDSDIQRSSIVIVTSGDSQDPTQIVRAEFSAEEALAIHRYSSLLLKDSWLTASSGGDTLAAFQSHELTRPTLQPLSHFRTLEQVNFRFATTVNGLMEFAEKNRLNIVVKGEDFLVTDLVVVDAVAANHVTWLCLREHVKNLGTADLSHHCGPFHSPSYFPPDTGSLSGWTVTCLTKDPHEKAFTRQAVCVLGGEFVELNSSRHIVSRKFCVLWESAKDKMTSANGMSIYRNELLIRLAEDPNANWTPFLVAEKESKRHVKIYRASTISLPPPLKYIQLEEDELYDRLTHCIIQHLGELGIVRARNTPICIEIASYQDCNGQQHQLSTSGLFETAMAGVEWHEKPKTCILATTMHIKEEKWLVREITNGLRSVGVHSVVVESENGEKLFLSEFTPKGIQKLIVAKLVGGLLHFTSALYRLLNSRGDDQVSTLYNTVVELVCWNDGCNCMAGLEEDGAVRRSKFVPAISTPFLSVRHEGDLWYFFEKGKEQVRSFEKSPSQEQVNGHLEKMCKRMAMKYGCEFTAACKKCIRFNEGAKGKWKILGKVVEAENIQCVGGCGKQGEYYIDKH